MEARKVQIVTVNRSSPHWVTAALPPNFQVSVAATTWRIAGLPSGLSLLASSDLGPQIIAAGDLMVATAFNPNSAAETKTLLRNFASIPRASADSSAHVPGVPNWRVMRLPRLLNPPLPAPVVKTPALFKWGKVSVRKFLHPTVDNALWESLES